MKCYLCGSILGRSSRCPACNSDVRDYKRIVASSNLYYNKALEKAKVRDLTGACANLKQSLYFFKGNTEARNLLGLVYYAMGELVPALSEWVISKSLQPTNNPAEDYLNRIQKNPGQLEKLNANVKRYNQALQYSQQGSYDLAVLQLKKVCSSNFPMLKAYHLLALLYIRSGEYDRAKGYLRTAAKIDVNNTTTLRYLKEVNSLIHETGYKSKKKKDITIVDTNGEYVSSGRGFVGGLLAVALNLAIGILAGGLAVYFLVIPGMKSMYLNSASTQVREANERLSSKDAMIQSYENQIEALNDQMDQMAEEASGDAEVTVQYAKLLNSYAYFVAGDLDKATEIYAEVDKDMLGTDTQTVYDILAQNLNPTLLESYYKEVQAANEAQDDDTAIIYYEKMIALDSSYLDGGLLYELAEAYSRKGRSDDALVLYQKLVDEFPDGKYAGTAAERIEEIQD